MTERQAFLHAIRANPHDDTARLVFADWLSDHDEPDRAEFIRGQIAYELDRDPAFKQRFHQLLAAGSQDGLTSSWWQKWTGIQSFVDTAWLSCLDKYDYPAVVNFDSLAFCMTCSASGYVAAIFQRGFITELRLPHSVFLQYSPGFSAEPVCKITLTAIPRAAHALSRQEARFMRKYFPKADLQFEQLEEDRDPSRSHW